MPILDKTDQITEPITVGMSGFHGGNNHQWGGGRSGFQGGNNHQGGGGMPGFHGGNNQQGGGGRFGFHGGNNHQGGGGRGGRNNTRGRGAQRGRNNRSFQNNRNFQGRGTRNNEPPPLFQICRFHFTGKNCTTRNCRYSHSIQHVTTIQNSELIPDQNNDNNDNINHPTSGVTPWIDPSGALKIFTSSYDHRFRLYNISTDSNTNGVVLTKEFEHDVKGPIEVLDVASNYLFCGFTGPSARIPGDVGMVHCWNLAQPSDEVVELTMHPDYTPYAHGGRVSAFLTGIGDMCVSGGQDGVIRIWKYGASVSGGKAGFTVLKECCGHVGEITGLAIVGGILWSSSTDATIRLWDAGGAGTLGSGTWECKYLITAKTPPQGAGTTPSQSIGGHTSPITALLPFESPSGSFIISSSLDGDVKIWGSSNGECKSSTNHGVGIVCMAITQDKEDNFILLCGTEKGKIMIRMIFPTASIPEPMRLIASLDKNFLEFGHEGPVKQIKAGPGNTFYSVGSDGNLSVYQMDKF